LIERTFSSRTKSGLAQSGWFWKTPYWAINDTNAQRLLKDYRRVGYLSLLVMALYGLSEMLLVLLFGKCR
jgi:hypothetical protein